VILLLILDINQQKALKSHRILMNPLIQKAATKAQEVALKFAQDSNSKLGKIKQASQGQFEINPRDKNNPHIKKIQVVSTVEYYLSD